MTILVVRRRTANSMIRQFCEAQPLGCIVALVWVICNLEVAYVE
jgi:hypothetical protein